MKCAKRDRDGNDGWLWAAAIATFAIILQTVLLGFAGSGEAMASAMARSSAPASEHGAHHADGSASCKFSCVCCPSIVALDAPVGPWAPRIVNNSVDASCLAATVPLLERPGLGANSARGPPPLV